MDAKTKRHRARVEPQAKESSPLPLSVSTAGLRTREQAGMTLQQRHAPPTWGELMLRVTWLPQMMSHLAPRHRTGLGLLGLKTSR